MSDNRLKNLSKLYHVPVFAVQELLERHIPDRKFTHLRQVELIPEVDKTVTILESDVDDLYENYRYGRRLSFYLYLLPEGLSKPNLENLQAAMDAIAVFPEDEHLVVEEADRDYEYDQNPDTVVLLDEEAIDGVSEIRFRYFVLRRFLNQEEQTDQVLQTRYGFLWLDMKNGFLTILSRDERINKVVIKALATCLQAIPFQVRLTKNLIDKHFPIENIKRVSHYDPLKGIRQSISGHGIYNEFKQEIRSREEKYIRPSSLYEEQIASGIDSGLGITASKGKFYLTKTLPTSIVRAWAKRRLPDLVDDLRGIRSDQPEIFNRSIEAINRMRLKPPGKAAVNMIFEGLLQASREQSTSAELNQSAHEIYSALEGKYINSGIASTCLDCEEAANSCVKCESQNLTFDGSQVICKDCKTVVSKDNRLMLRCMNAHCNEYPLSDSMILSPNIYFQKRVEAVFKEISQDWDVDEDFFLIEGHILHRFKKGQVDKIELPRQIVNYFERVIGPVHTGSGDINIERESG